MSFLGIVFTHMLTLNEPLISQVVPCHWGYHFSPWGWRSFCNQWLALHTVWNQVGGGGFRWCVEGSCLRNRVWRTNSRVWAENWSVNTSKGSRMSKQHRHGWRNLVDGKFGGSETSPLCLFNLTGCRMFVYLCKFLFLCFGFFLLLLYSYSAVQKRLSHI